jgi:hypothetical protein
LAVVERVELFLRSQRPALALQLGGAWATRVELERTAPGEVALTVVAPKGAPAHAELSMLRQALQARGVRLSRLLLRR